MLHLPSALRDALEAAGPARPQGPSDVVALISPHVVQIGDRLLRTVEVRFGQGLVFQDLLDAQLPATRLRAAVMRSAERMRSARPDHSGPVGDLRLVLDRRR